MIYLLNSKLEHHIGEWFIPEDIEHIAYRLSYINRFTGSVGCYSVAQHSVEVAMQLPDRLKLSGLLHDVSEAYIGDIAKPLKAHIQGYDALEDFYCDVIDKHFGVTTRHPLVKEADTRMVLTEGKSFGFPDGILGVPGEPYGRTVIPLRPSEAQSQFLKIYKDLTDELL